MMMTSTTEKNGSSAKNVENSFMLPVQAFMDVLPSRLSVKNVKTTEVLTITPTDGINSLALLLAPRLKFYVLLWKKCGNLYVFLWKKCCNRYVLLWKKCCNCLPT